MRKKKKGKEPNAERWMLTYLDLITLLMVFFVILYASSNIDKEKFQNIAKSFNIAMGGGGSQMVDLGLDSTSKDDKSVPNQEVKDSETKDEETQSNDETYKMEKVKKELDKYMAQNKLKSSVTSAITERGLVVSLKNTAFFDSGKATIKRKYKSKIVAIAKIVNKLPNYIRIEGHTDNVPIHTSNFSSNWSLSSARATNVVELVIKKAQITPNKVSAGAFADTRPIASNSTAAGRAKNRRMDIVLLSSKFNSEEEVSN